MLYSIFFLLDVHIKYSYSLCEQIQDSTNISLLCRWSLENSEGRESSKCSFGTGNISVLLLTLETDFDTGIKVSAQGSVYFLDMSYVVPENGERIIQVIIKDLLFIFT